MKPLEPSDPRTIGGIELHGRLGEGGMGADSPWLAMEYVRGETLREYLAVRSAVTAERGAALGVLLAEALTGIHTARATLLHALTKHYPYAQKNEHALYYAIMNPEQRPDVSGTSPPRSTPEPWKPHSADRPGHATLEVQPRDERRRFTATGRPAFGSSQVGDRPSPAGPQVGHPVSASGRRNQVLVGHAPII